MRFRINRQIISSKYYAIPECFEISNDDRAWFRKFGEPALQIKMENGTVASARLTILANYSHFGFADQGAAEQYANDLKLQISGIRTEMAAKSDTWSNIEDV